MRADSLVLLSIGKVLKTSSAIYTYMNRTNFYFSFDRIASSAATAKKWFRISLLLRMKTETSAQTAQTREQKFTRTHRGECRRLNRVRQFPRKKNDNERPMNNHRIHLNRNMQMNWQIQWQYYPVAICYTILIYHVACTKCLSMSIQTNLDKVVQ